MEVDDKRMQSSDPTEEEEVPGKRKIGPLVNLEDERKGKRKAIFGEEAVEEDVEMIEEDAAREDNAEDSEDDGDNETIMEDNVEEEIASFDFDGYF